MKIVSMQIIGKEEFRICEAIIWFNYIKSTKSDLQVRGRDFRIRHVEISKSLLYVYIGCMEYLG